MKIANYYDFYGNIYEVIGEDVLSVELSDVNDGYYLVVSKRDLYEYGTPIDDLEELCYGKN